MNNNVFLPWKEKPFVEDSRGNSCYMCLPANGEQFDEIHLSFFIKRKYRKNIPRLNMHLIIIYELIWHHLLPWNMSPVRNPIWRKKPWDQILILSTVRPYLKAHSSQLLLYSLVVYSLPRYSLIMNKKPKEKEPITSNLNWKENFLPFFLANYLPLEF